MLPTVAAVLAGGLGTRLRSVVSDRSKTVAVVRDRPFLLYLLDQLADAGVRRVVLLTGYRGEQIADLLGTAYRGLELEYSRESEPLGTAGALRLALPQLFRGARDEASRVLLLNGDSYCAADLPDFCTFAGRRAAGIALLSTRVDDAARFGRVEIADDGRVTSFVEKQASAGAGWINAGIYLIPRAAIEEIPPGRAVSLEKDLFPEWSRRGALYGYRGGGAFLDIGTPESYRIAETFFAGTASGAEAA